MLSPEKAVGRKLSSSSIFKGAIAPFFRQKLTEFLRHKFYPNSAKNFHCFSEKHLKKCHFSSKKCYFPPKKCNFSLKNFFPVIKINIFSSFPWVFYGKKILAEFFFSPPKISGIFFWPLAPLSIFLFLIAFCLIPRSFIKGMDRGLPGDQ